MSKIQAFVISVGTELLTGQTINTNMKFLGRALNEVGIWVVGHQTVPDHEQAIMRALDAARNQAALVILTGGLGGTSDDITKKTVSKYIGSEGNVLHEKEWLRIKDYFTKRGRDAYDVHRMQASLPKECEPITNSIGLAPGMYLSYKGVTIVALPGVPSEMKTMMKEVVFPKLALLNQGNWIEHRHFILMGIGESDAARRLQGVENELPPYISLAYLPGISYLKLRLTSMGNATNTKQYKQDLEKTYETAKATFCDVTLAEGDLSLEQLIGQQLRKMGKSVGTAESCTGGYISHLITSVAGSSDYYMGSIIAYAYDVKENALHVDRDMLYKYGAVSEECVRQMAKGSLEALCCDYTIAVTGIMGPGGDQEHKPLGTVWIAVGSKEQLVVHKYLFSQNRMHNIHKTASTALAMLSQMLAEELQRHR